MREPVFEIPAYPRESLGLLGWDFRDLARLFVSIQPVLGEELSHRSIHASATISVQQSPVPYEHLLGVVECHRSRRLMCDDGPYELRMPCGEIQRNLRSSTCAE